MIVFARRPKRAIKCGNCHRQIPAGEAAVVVKVPTNWKKGWYTRATYCWDCGLAVVDTLLEDHADRIPVTASRAGRPQKSIHPKEWHRLKALQRYYQKSNSPKRLVKLAEIEAKLAGLVVAK